ncbi:root hair defective 3-like protein, partial [Tanacetum coccineum]
FQSLKLLSVFAAIRLDGDTDTIEDTLALRLLGPNQGTLKTSQDPLASKTWKEVGATNTLISPVECNLLWNQFLRETGDTITQASQEVKKRKNDICGKNF